PVLAAAGADVTIFDQSENQLAQDKTLSDKHALDIKTVKGDMRDLSVFNDNTFDVVFNPCSVVFVEELEPVWRECHRVLKPGGVLMSGLINPVIFQLEQERGAFRLAYPQPFSDIHSLPKQKLNELIANNETLEFGHTLTDQIGGQLNAGFVVTDFYEDDWNGERDLDKFLPSFFATRAVKS
ncbi:MAG TPA: methyltransferase domain-containing protein, partial [Bacteroidales bacterium]|nr:methyltransferase domain-containing protein [Bacteroidales bacterium]